MLNPKTSPASGVQQVLNRRDVSCKQVHVDISRLARPYLANDDEIAVVR